MMVTKPTGRPPGRPKKSKAIAIPKQPRGRPVKLLCEDPERYLLSLLQAHIEMGALIGKSDNAIAETFVGMYYGRLLKIPENIEAFERGEKFRVFMLPGDPGFITRGALGGATWRDKDIFRQIAAIKIRYLREVRNGHVANPNRRWLAAMTRAWISCYQGMKEDMDLARSFALLAGEGRYFAEIMAPFFRERAARGLEELNPYEKAEEVIGLLCKR
jgi:hypothetical protein